MGTLNVVSLILLKTKIYVTRVFMLMNSTLSLYLRRQYYNNNLLKGQNELSNELL